MLQLLKIERHSLLLIAISAVTAIQATIANMVNSAFAQQDFGIRQGFGIPIIEMVLGIIVILVFYGLIIIFVKGRRSQAIAGATVILLSLLIIAITTPVYMHSFYAGSTHPYCQDNPCNNRSDKPILKIASYPELAHYTTLNKAVFAARHEGYNNCCAITPISYFEELSFYLSAADSTVKLNRNDYSYDDAYLFQMRDEYYTVSFHHLDNDFNYAYLGTTFTIDTVYLMTIIPALAFFSIILPRPSKVHARIGAASVTDSLQSSKIVRILRWLAGRRLAIPLIGFIVLVAAFVVSIWLGSDYHQSTYGIVINTILSLLAWVGIIVVTRSIQRRKMTVAK